MKRFLVACFVLTVGLAGCTQMAETEETELKNPHFIAGKTHVRNMDTDRAIRAFEDALASNPRNASAHLELGLLFEAKHDLVSAIYHFQKHLELRPNSNNASVAKQKINAWSMEFASSIAPVLNPQTQAHIAYLSTQNEQLRQENAQLRNQLPSATARAPANQPARGNTNLVPIRPREDNQIATPGPSPGPSPTAQLKDYKIQPGDNPTKIAKANGLGSNYKLILDANPGLTERNLQVGRVIKIPIP